MYVYLKIHTPSVVHIFKIFHSGCMDFKWSGPLFDPVNFTCSLSSLAFSAFFSFVA